MTWMPPDRPQIPPAPRVDIPVLHGFDRAPDWTSKLRSQMFSRRIVLLNGELTDEVATCAAAELMTLDASGDEAVTLQIDASGGSIEAAFVVMDTLDLLGVTARTVVLGRAEGPVAGVAAVGHSRFAAAHARFRLAWPRTSTVAGGATEVIRWAEQARQQQQRFAERVAQACERAVDDVTGDFDRGRHLSTDEAIAAGLVDRLWTGSR